MASLKRARLIVSALSLRQGPSAIYSGHSAVAEFNRESMLFSPMIRHAAVSILRHVPEGELHVRSLYHRRSILCGVRLLCYAEGKATFDWFRELGAGDLEVDIETLFTGINVGTERAKFYRMPNTFAEFPYVPSSPGVGRVIRAGRKVTGLRPGDLVIGLLKNASRQHVAAGDLLKIENVPLEQAALVRLGIVAIQGLRMGRVRPGQRVLVMGQGIIGRLATLLARGEGVEEVFCLTRTAEKLRCLGETQGITLADTAAPGRLAQMGADVVMDVTGDPQALHIAVQAARPGGRIVLLGSSRGVTRDFDMNGPVMDKGLTIVGAHRQNLEMMPPEIGGDYAKEVAHIVELIRLHKLSLADAVTHRIACDQLAESYGPKLFDAGDVCGVIVDWTNSRQLAQKRPTARDLTVREPSSRVPRRLRIALVGCGGIGVVNAAAIAGSSSVELAACMDTNRSLAEELGRKYAVPGTDSLEAVLRDSTIDAVFIATPHHLHAPLASRAGRAGKHILVEKPLAISMEEADEMIASAQTNRVVLRTFLSRKYKLPFLVARRLVEHDALGRLIGISISSYLDQSQAYWTGGRRGRSQSDWRSRREQSGGGMLIMNLVHDIDALHYVTGISIDSVFSHHAALYHPVEVEDTVGLTFTSSKGAIGTISASNAVKGGGEGCLRLWGENGQILIHNDHVWFRSLRPIFQYEAQRNHTICCREPDADLARALCLNDFARAVLAGEPGDETEAGYRALAVVMAAYQSQEVAHPVPVGKRCGEAERIPRAPQDLRSAWPP